MDRYIVRTLTESAECFMVAHTRPSYSSFSSSIFCSQLVPDPGVFFSKWRVLPFFLLLAIFVRRFVIVFPLLFCEGGGEVAAGTATVVGENDVFACIVGSGWRYACVLRLSPACHVGLRRGMFMGVRVPLKVIF